MNNVAAPPNGCPLPDMTTGEILRFLDDGYASGVQSALSSHVETCDQCTAAAQRAKQLQSSGHATLVAALDGPVPDPDRTGESAHLSAMALARFTDGTAPDPERAAITEHLVTCPSCYRQFAGMTEELDSSPAKRFQTPAAALRRVRAEQTSTQTAPSATRSAAPASPQPDRPGLLERIQTALDELLAPRWVVGLGGALAGLLLAVALFGLPPERVVVPLGGGDATESGRVMSGMDATPPEPAVSLPTTQPTFTWAAVSNTTGYALTLSSAGGDVLLETSASTERWSTPSGLLQRGETYMLVVTAQLDNGAVVPLERLRFQVRP